MRMSAMCVRLPGWSPFMCTAQAVVVRMLSDSKLEVREVAATTLSGLLKGASPAETAQLRASFLSDVDRLFPRSRKRQKAKAGAEASGAATRMLPGSHRLSVGLSNDLPADARCAWHGKGQVCLQISVTSLMRSFGSGVSRVHCSLAVTSAGVHAFFGCAQGQVSRSGTLQCWACRRSCR